VAVIAPVAAKVERPTPARETEIEIDPSAALVTATMALPAMGIAATGAKPSI